MFKRLPLILLTVTFSLADEVIPEIPDGVTRPFVSGQIWTNPMEDWQLKEGRMVNTHSGGDRNAVSLTSSVKAEGEFEISATFDQLSPALKSEGFVGFKIGIQGAEEDYREAAIYGVGIPVGLLPDGRLFIGTPEDNAPIYQIPEGDFKISINGTANSITLKVGEQNLTRANIAPGWTTGLVAVATSTKNINHLDLSKHRPKSKYGSVGFGSSGKEDEEKRLSEMNKSRGGEARFSFSDWKIRGSAVEKFPERSYGPIWWSTYTVHADKKVRILVQMAPVTGEVTLNIGGAETAAQIDPISHTALFEQPLLQPERDIHYSLKHGDDIQTGMIRAIPDGSNKLTVASLSCNDSTGFPHARLEANVAAHKPDVITFHGDQIYESIGGYGYIVDQQPNARAILSYLRKYAMHGWTWRKILMTTPSITIPDDHDVMHGNLWGAGGKLAEMKGDIFNAQDSGGYKMSPQFVNMVHRTQTGNLPIPKDQPQCKNGITTYYTSWQYGPLDFAIIADRQFKSAPKIALPEARIHNGWPQNLDWDAKTQSLKPGLELLGKAQEEFLASWATQEAPFKIVISQSPFLAPQTLPEEMHHDKDVPKLPVYREGEYAPNDEPKADFDTNGWPQDKQKLALKLLKRANAVHLVGDQHLGTTGQYGIEDYDDGTWWLATPAIANVWPRRWMPKVTPKNPKPEWPRWLGGFEDGFGNKFTLHAVSNPWDIDEEPSRLFDRAVGYGITTYHSETKTITFANWPYTAGPKDIPYQGWPITVQR